LTSEKKRFLATLQRSVVMIHLAILIEHRLVTDRLTDKHRITAYTALS